MIKITPKDPRYPSAGKISWIAKTNFLIQYAEVCDKKNEFFKGFSHGFKDYALEALACEEAVAFIRNEFATDFKSP